MKCKKCGNKMQKAGRHRNSKGLFQKYKCMLCAAIRLGEELQESCIPKP